MKAGMYGLVRSIATRQFLPLAWASMHGVSGGQQRSELPPTCAMDCPMPGRFKGVCSHMVKVPLGFER